ncbi:response regulator transcription factor [Nocardioides sp. zg-DK7169]|uniref:response regulator n=1 Tax=Nocardioides sp. zg-DK7169 TaxID=2736600 RepID=UPI001552A95F|nr:response regulator transcription factor [Nocardioides sp. zg-DK7169]NPC95272.1 response regulator transcription factor [Nocardioides sp. zg-DK7169]
MHEDLTIATPATATGPTRTLIVDDNPVVRTGLRSLLESSAEIEIVGEAADGVLAESMVHSLRPDVVLLDVRMPRRDGVQTARAIAGETTVIMLTFTDEPEHIRAALAAGASGYLVHGSFDASTLVHTVRQAALGAGAFSRQALEAIRDIRAPHDPAEERRERQRRFDLSDRQGELMALIAQGMSNAEIARELYLAEKTVKNHVNAIFAKLVVTSRSEAIAVWLGTRAQG